MEEITNVKNENDVTEADNRYDKYLNGEVPAADASDKDSEKPEEAVTANDSADTETSDEEILTSDSTAADNAEEISEASASAVKNEGPDNSAPVNGFNNMANPYNGYPMAGGYGNSYPGAVNGYPGAVNPYFNAYPNANNGYGNAYPNAGGYNGYQNAGAYGYPNMNGYNPNYNARPNMQGNMGPAAANVSSSFAGKNQAEDPYSRYSRSNSTDMFNSYKNYNSTDEESKDEKEAAEEKPKKQKSKAAKFFTGLGLAAAFGAVAAGVFIGTIFLYNKYSGNPLTANGPVHVTTSNEISVQDGSQAVNLAPVGSSDSSIATTDIISHVNSTATDVSTVVENCMPSIVSIKVTGTTSTIWGRYPTESAGSGIIIEKTDKELIIATNNHVVSDATSITITFSDESTASATIKGTDSVADLAVVAVKLEELSDESLKAIRVATLGDSDDVKVGQMAVAIGNSLGYGQSVTVGYISAKDREVTVDSQKMVLLQTDAAINPGNSGGALINLDGEVIGINSVKYADSSVEGMGFAIPISRAQNILAELATREVLSAEEQGYLGIYYNVVKKEIADSYNWPMGIYVKEAIPDCPAENAGIKTGDIITKLNDTEITTDKQFIDKLSSLRSGVEITLTVQRLEEGSFVEYTFKVTLGERPKNDSKTEEKTEEKTEDKPDSAPSEKTPDGSEGSIVDPYDYYNNNSGDAGNGYYTNPYGDGYFDPFDFFFNP